MTELETRVAQIEGKQSGIDIYLPQLLARFENIERNMNDRFEDMQRDIKQTVAFARYERIAIIVAIASVAAAIFFR